MDAYWFPSQRFCKSKTWIFCSPRFGKQRVLCIVSKILSKQGGKRTPMIKKLKTTHSGFGEDLCVCVWQRPTLRASMICAAPEEKNSSGKTIILGCLTASFGFVYACVTIGEKRVGVRVILFWPRGGLSTREPSSYDFEKKRFRIGFRKKTSERRKHPRHLKTPNNGRLRARRVNGL